MSKFDKKIQDYVVGCSGLMTDVSAMSTLVGRRMQLLTYIAAATAFTSYLSILIAYAV